MKIYSPLKKILSRIHDTYLGKILLKIFHTYFKFHRRFVKTPDGFLLERWRRGEWDDYQLWLNSHALLSVKEWSELRNQALVMDHPPKISILVPTYNPIPEFFEDLIHSVIFQSYPFWELCIVDDGSTEKESIKCLKKILKRDSRIKLKLFKNNNGICHTTNAALEMANGEYVAFLDHDDRLSPDALHYIGKKIIYDSGIDILYSDRDMISPNGNRFMHLFKPDWAPETLLTMNYIFHLMVYRKKLLISIGGLRKEFEGSQDYDLILRAMDLNPKVCHIPKILYHWRQHEKSVAMNLESKNYAFTAGVNALKDLLKRRGLTGDVVEIKDLPRGHYKVTLTPPKNTSYKVFHINQNDFCGYRQALLNSIDLDDDLDFLVFLGGNVKPEIESSIPALLSWFQIPEIGMVTGKIFDLNNNIIHGGLILKPDGIPLSIFNGFPDTEYGYMGAVHIAKNVSIPHPYCFAVRKQIIKDFGGFDSNYKGPHAVMDLGLRIIEKGHRIMFSPFEKFFCEEEFIDLQEVPDSDRIYFMNKWEKLLNSGDPNYNKCLTLEHNDMALSI